MAALSLTHENTCESKVLQSTTRLQRGRVGSPQCVLCYFTTLTCGPNNKTSKPTAPVNSSQFVSKWRGCCLSSTRFSVTNPGTDHQNEERNDVYSRAKDDCGRWVPSGDLDLHQGNKVAKVHYPQHDLATEVSCTLRTGNAHTPSERESTRFWPQDKRRVSYLQFMHTVWTDTAEQDVAESSHCEVVFTKEPLFLAVL